MTRATSILSTVSFVLALTSCSLFGITIDKGGSEGGGGTKRSGSTYQSYKVLKIPYGHLPPAGECKVWIPGKPPGQQSAPTSCSSARSSVPANGWVIRRKPGNNDLLEVDKCGSVPGKIVSSETYIIDNE